MPLLLLSVLIAVPLIEIGVFIQVGGAIGLWPTLGAIVLTALAGSALIRHQGLAILGQARDSFAAGRLPVREIFDGICLLLAGASVDASVDASITSNVSGVWSGAVICPAS